MKALGHFVCLPPIQFGDMLGQKAGGTRERPVSEWCDEPGFWVAFCQPPKRREIAVIVVIMTHQNHINARQGFERNPGRMHTLGAGPCEWAGALTVDGIDEHIPVPGLQQKTGVVDPSHRQRSIGGCWGWCAWRHFHVLWPCGGARGQFPSQNLEPMPVDVVTRIEKLSSIAVVRDGKAWRQGHVEMPP